MEAHSSSWTPHLQEALPDSLFHPQAGARLNSNTAPWWAEATQDFINISNVPCTLLVHSQDFLPFRTVPGRWGGGLPFFLYRASRPHVGCVALRVLRLPRAPAHTPFPSPDRPVRGGPLRAHLPGLELLPVHHPHARRHGPVHHRRYGACGWQVRPVDTHGNPSGWWGAGGRPLPQPGNWPVRVRHLGFCSCLCWPGCCVHSSPTRARAGDVDVEQLSLPELCSPPFPSPVEARAPPALSSPPTGGLAAVIYTDALQTLIMVVGAVILTVKGERPWGLSQQRALWGLGATLSGPRCPYWGSVASRGQATRQSAPHWPPLGDGGLLPSHPCCPAALLSPAPGRMASGCGPDSGGRAVRTHAGSGLNGSRAAGG